MGRGMDNEAGTYARLSAPSLVSLPTGMFHNMELCALQNVERVCVCVWKN